MNDQRASRSADKRRSRYSTEFKCAALEKLNSGQYSLRRLANELGISVVTLMNWRRDEPRSQAPPNNPPADIDEISRLRAEIAELKQERDRLRKGIAYLVGLDAPEK